MESSDAHDTGKASSLKPAGEPSGINGGYRPTHAAGSSHNPILNVEPPRKEDLQPSYAQLLGDADAGNYGWYGSMSKLNNPRAVSHRPLESSR